MTDFGMSTQAKVPTDRIPETAPRREAYSASEVAEMLGVTRALVYRMVQGKVLPRIRAGSRILIPKKAVDKYLMGQE